jgi:pimeloyl-ACP methyl ester carboxylesterase
MKGRTAVCIHGMWGTPQVWANWRSFFEARGWRMITPALRHHEAPPLEPPAGLGATSLLDYVADLKTLIEGLPEKPVVIGHSMGGLIALLLCARGLATRGALLTPAPPASVFAIRGSNLLAFMRIQLSGAWWRNPHRQNEPEALAYTFNTTPREEAIPLHNAFVHESGRALFEIAFPWLDRGHAASVAPADIKVPLLFVSAEQDKLVPPSVVRSSVARFPGAEHRFYRGQGHWVLGQPGWQAVAQDVAAWLEL